MWQKDWTVGPGVVVSPFAQARGDYYQIETTPDHYETRDPRARSRRRASRVGRSCGPGQNFDLIVEPVVMAAYASQNANDPRIVNEDSLGFQLDDSDLFRPNGAPNYDLWEPGGRVSAGVRMTARAHTGESASLLFGRRWRDPGGSGIPAMRRTCANRRRIGSARVQADLGHSLWASTRASSSTTRI